MTLEYLLSILSSQGDAGQFRTPRHIIDFIVEVVDPKKNETILDPACGTAGFLISAYKHILKHNSSDFHQSKEKAKTAPAEKTYLGDRLTPNEKKKLMRNFVGYDISPDMVKLSLVNMYLHGFPDPEIHEYDTLTSENRWGEEFDVILANPPFMSPTGGIRPHKRFSVQAKRSEVLFVDYIVEHLSLKGRAGIIVPQGITSTVNNAYKQLRQMLVEDGLFAVVSLPSGVFNPYTGVKTSILLFDNQLGKKADEILFLKIENDGFDLGAQRRKIDKDNLPEALEILKAWKQGKKKKSSLALWASKEKIAESEDYNLTGGQYLETKIHKNQKWPMVELGEVCEVKRGQTITRKQVVNGDVPVVAGGQQPAYLHNKANREPPVITVSGSGAYAGFVNFFNEPIYASDCSTIKPKDREKVDIQFVYRFLKSKQKEIHGLQQGTGQPHVYAKDLAKIRIPLPPLSVQKEIVEQIEVKQNAINHAKEIIKNLERERRYFGEEIRKLEGVDFTALKEVIKLTRGVTYTKSDEVKDSGHKILRANNISLDGRLVLDDIKQISIKKDLKNKQKLKADDIFICLASGSKDHIGKVAFIESNTDFYFGGFMGAIRTHKDKSLPKYIFYSLYSGDFNDYLRKAISGANINNLSAKILGAFKLPLPSLEVQKQLIAEVEKEEEIIASNRRLIEILEQKIAGVLKTI